MWNQTAHEYTWSETIEGSTMKKKVKLSQVSIRMKTVKFHDFTEEDAIAYIKRMYADGLVIYKSVFCEPDVDVEKHLAKFREEVIEKTGIPEVQLKDADVIERIDGHYCSAECRVS